MPKPARHPTTDDGRPNGLTDNQSEPGAAESHVGYRFTGRAVESVHDEITSPDPFAAAHRPGEICVMMQPIRLRKHPERPSGA